MAVIAVIQSVQAHSARARRPSPPCVGWRRASNSSASSFTEMPRGFFEFDGHPNLIGAFLPTARFKFFVGSKVRLEFRTERIWRHKMQPYLIPVTLFVLALLFEP